jgi:hypothetical protein
MYWCRIVFHQWWFLEAASFVWALALFDLYVFLLRKWDNRPVGKWEETVKWRLGLSLSSLVSLIATLLRGAVLLPVTSALGQLKWHYYKQPRPLKTMDRIDHASRGPLGSGRLLLKSGRKL